MTYEFDCEVTLFQPQSLGKGDYPKGEGYSPYFVLPSLPHPVAVRFMNFQGPFDVPSIVTVSLYHGLGPSDLTIESGEAFEITMGLKTVGRGMTLTGLREQIGTQNKAGSGKA